VIVDYHMHPRRPAGAVEEIDHTLEAIERYVEAAGRAGVDEIGFSEHVYYFAETRQVWDLPYQLDRCRFPLEAYCRAVTTAKERGLPVKLGLEVDYLPGRVDELSELLEPYPWDYLLGSIHWIEGLAVDQRPGLWEDRSVEDVWRAYFETLGEAAEAGFCDVLAHPDLAKIWGERPDASVVSDLHERVAAAVGATGLAVEVSAAGLRKPVGEVYPDAALLRLLRERGVPVTLASDAHLASDVGRGIGDALAHARAAGYETVTVFDGRQARQEPLG
jgi:histidinol-phosphatase (PHP family)